MTADPRWPAVRDRNPAADGVFVYAVVTTGVFCRPSCPSRRPSVDNVRFFATPQDARAAGYRACKRCRPGSVVHPRAATVVAVCRAIEAAPGAVPLGDLAERVGLGPAQVRRCFREALGVTPHAYGVAVRRHRVQAALHEGASVTDAIHAAGYGSSSRFYERATASLGMAPRDYRHGGPNERIGWAVAESSLGVVLVAATRRGVCAILLGDEPEPLIADLARRFPEADRQKGDDAFGALVTRVVAKVEHPNAPFDVPLDIRGTAFQQRVWAALQEIPVGATVGYAELARRIDAPGAARAVAGACAANALAVVVPCHRVVRADGGLSGYRWGPERKAALLELEREGSARDLID